MVAAVFEATLDAGQAADLARLMDEGRPTRPEGVVTATLLFDGALGRLVAVWESRAALERYLATAAVPRGEELMRKVGAEPTMTIVDVLEHA
jgi:quinol monooxygenase YgiN